MENPRGRVRCGGLVGLDVVVGHVGQERTGLGAELTPLLGFLVGEQGLQGHVEAEALGSTGSNTSTDPVADVLSADEVATLEHLLKKVLP